MIRFAIFLTVLTFVGYRILPKWSADFSRPFFEQCLNITPRVHHKSEIQSLVCGSTLQRPRASSTQRPRASSTQRPRASSTQYSRASSTEAKSENFSSRDDASSIINSWRNLGLIHILVVSGGHLTILAALLSIVRPRRNGNRLAKKFHTAFVGLTLIFFCLANELQPPVLRALLEWMLRTSFHRRGWRTPETAFVATWFALPFSSSIYDLLSLALSFFASVTVEQTARRLYRHRWLQAVALQLAVWWVLLPLLFTMGVPHPLTSMSNIVLAPLLGATVIPLAMITWISGALPNISGYSDDPVGLGYAFDFGWEKLNFVLVRLADFLPHASPRINGAKPLIFGIELTLALLIAVAAATAALLVRSRRESRRQRLDRSQIPAWLFVSAAFAAALVVHAQL